MDSQPILPQLTSGLSLELKLMIIFWMVKIDKPIHSISWSAKQEALARVRRGYPILYDSPICVKNEIRHPVLLFSADDVLQGWALAEFWKANTFKVEACVERLNYGTPEQEWCPSLNDDPSRRPHARNIKLVTCAANNLGQVEEDKVGMIGKNDIGVLRQIAEAYPKLQRLMVTVKCDPYFCVAAHMHPEPARVMAWERLQYFKNVLRAVQTLEAIKYKTVEWRVHHDLDPVSIGHEVEIDGRGRGLEPLAWETLEYSQAVVRL